MTEMKYEIGDKILIQRPLVLGQLRQLLAVLDGITLPADLNTRSLVEALGDQLPRALAVVLTEQGKSPKDKDIDTLAEEIDYGMSLEQIVQAVEDFFVCNPLSSLLDKLTGAAGKIGATMQQTQSRISASSSPAAPSIDGTESSGDSPSKSAGPGSDTASGTSSSGKP